MSRMLLLICCVLTLSACAAARPAVSTPPAPTLDPAHWKVYTDMNHHFSFQYPKSYDDRPLCAPKVKEADPFSPVFWVSMNNSDLKVAVTPLSDPKQTDPQSAVDALRSMLSQQPQVSLEQPVKMTVAGLPAVAQRYHTAYSKDGYLEYVYFIKDGNLYTISINTPATCDGYPDTPTAVEAYQRILESFKLQ